jgi:hypothetical protein
MWMNAGNLGVCPQKQPYMWMNERKLAGSFRKSQVCPQKQPYQPCIWLAFLSRDIQSAPSYIMLTNGLICGWVFPSRSKSIFIHILVKFIADTWLIKLNYLIISI